MIDEVIKLIDKLPTVLQFFVPGFIFISVFSWLTQKRTENGKMVILSCVISHIAMSIVNLVELLPIDFLHNSWFKIFLSFVLTAGVSIILSLIFKKKSFHSFLVTHFKTSQYDNVISSLVDRENGTAMRIYLKNKEFYIFGHYKSFDGMYISIRAPQKFSVINDELISSDVVNWNAFSVFNINDIDYLMVTSTA